MRTSKPISTISYNSIPFLRGKLEELVSSHKISDYIFIKHFAESDEKKDHIHVWIRPNTIIDSMSVQDALHEFDISNPSKPLGCIDFVNSSVDDFILYAMHHEQYLAFKGQSREYHYSRDDFYFHDLDTFDELFHHALSGSSYASQAQRLELLNSGVEPSKLIRSGSIPLNMTTQVAALVRLDNGVYRGGRSSHTPKSPREEAEQVPSDLVSDIIPVSDDDIDF